MTRAAPDYRLVIFLVGLTQLIITVDFSIVTVALPSIGHQLRARPADLSWVLSAGALAGGGLLILAGRAADIFGQRLCLLVGLTLFGAGSLGAASSPDLPMLIAARVLQGIGGAVLGPANFSLINVLVPEGAPRRLAIGVFGLMQGVSLVIGLLIGGALTTHFGWRAVFLLNPPLALLAIAVAMRCVPKPQSPPKLERDIDWLGAVLITTAMALILLGVSAMGREGWTAPRPLAMLASGIAVFALFFVAESRARAPLAPLSIFRRRNYTAANVIMPLILVAVGGVFVLLSVYMQTSLRFTAQQSGLGMMPYAAAVMISGQALTPLMARLPNRVIVFAAAALLVLGVTLLALLSQQPNYWVAIALGSVVTALGATTAFIALLAEATADIPAPQQGTASAVMFTFHAIGIPLGATVALSVLGLAGPAGGLAAFRDAYLVLAATVFLALVVGVFTLRSAPTAVAEAVAT